jgi:hypothetical protein
MFMLVFDTAAVAAAVAIHIYVSQCEPIGANHGLQTNWVSRIASANPRPLLQ